MPDSTNIEDPPMEESIINAKANPITINLGQSRRPATVEPKQLRNTTYAIRNTKICKTNPI